MSQPTSFPLGALLLGALAIPAPCQGDLPDGAKLLDQTEKNTWFTANNRRPKTVIIKGVARFQLLEMPDAPEAVGTFEGYYSDDKVFSRTDLKQYGMMLEGTDGETVWEVDPLNGASILTGQRAAEKVRQWGLNRGNSWRTHYSRAKCVGTSEIDGKKCWKIETRYRVGDGMDTWHVEQDREIVLGMKVRMHTPNGLEDVDIRFSGWTKEDGSYRTSAMEVLTGHVSIELDVEDLVFDEEIPAERFALPKAIRELVGETEEEVAVDPDLEVKIVQAEERHVASIRTKVKVAEMGQALAVIIPEVYNYVNESGAQMLGPPFTRYHEFGTDTVEFEAGIPVMEPVEGKGRIKAGTLPGGKLAMTWHIGDYHKLGETHERLDRWLEKESLAKSDVVWEVYWTDPGREPDSSKWRTQVFFKLK